LDLELRQALEFLDLLKSLKMLLKLHVKSLDFFCEEKFRLMMTTLYTWSTNTSEFWLFTSGIVDAKFRIRAFL
jgi:hypothetical protein